jgi:hypothetical protein
MIIYKLECLNEDGAIECNGYYEDKKDAEIAKKEVDEYPMNKRYGIKQNITEEELIERKEIRE